MPRNQVALDLTPAEYNVLVGLTKKAYQIVEERVGPYLSGVKGSHPFRGDRIVHINFQSADPERLGRHPEGLMDLVVTYKGYDDPYEIYLPSAILWDLPGAISATNAYQAAREAESRAMEAAYQKEMKAKYADSEREQAAKLAKKYGYVKK